MSDCLLQSDTKFDSDGTIPERYIERKERVKVWPGFTSMSPVRLSLQ